VNNDLPIINFQSFLFWHIIIQLLCFNRRLHPIISQIKDPHISTIIYTTHQYHIVIKTHGSMSCSQVSQRITPQRKNFHTYVASRSLLELESLLKHLPPSTPHIPNLARLSHTSKLWFSFFLLGGLGSLNSSFHTFTKTLLNINTLLNFLEIWFSLEHIVVKPWAKFDPDLIYICKVIDYFLH